MASEELMNFKHDNKTISVFTGQSSSDVYFSVNGGSSRSAGIRWNEARGDYKSGSGNILSHEQARSIIRNQI